jgi:hypothetical protein
MSGISGKLNKMENEDFILNLPQEYLVFLDESGDSKIHEDISIYKRPTVYPVFTITALLIKKEDYQNKLLPRLLHLKEKFFQNKEIIFHSNDIRRKNRGFKIFLDENVYSDFKKDIVEVIDKSKIKIISCSIKKDALLERSLRYRKDGVDYDFGNVYLKNFEFVLERLAHFLNKKNASAKLIFETVGKAESKKIQKTLDSLKQDGTFYHNSSVFDRIDEEILFYMKKDVVNGLQIADYLVNPFAKHAKDSSEDNQLYEILLPYVYNGDRSQYGLKIWP